MTDETGMALDEYVQTTLLAIVRGVVSAQADENLGAHIGRTPQGGDHLNVATDGHSNTVSMVEFDVATTVQDKTEAGAGLGIKVVSMFNINAGARSEAVASAVSRLTFRVPISIPKPQAQKLEDIAERDRRNAEYRQALERNGGTWMGA